jgi:hypothetical protein
MKALITAASRRPDITIYRSGRIDISAHVADKLDIHQEDVIDIAADDDGEIYLYVSHRAPLYGRFRGRCVRTNRCGRHMRAHSEPICDELFRQMHLPASVLVARIASGELRTINNVNYLTLILKRHD